MKNYAFIALLLLAALPLQAQDTLYVYDGLDRLPESVKKDKASYYLLTTQPQQAFQGEVRFFDKTTHRLHAQIAYDQEGKRSGTATYFYPEGGKKHEFAYAQGEMKGPYSNWYQNGQLKSQGMAMPILKSYESPAQGTYTVTDYLLHHYWDSLGNQLLADGTGELVLHHKNGTLKERGFYQAGRKEGQWTGYREDGGLYFEEVYQKGSLQKGISYIGEQVYTYTSLEEEAQPLLGMQGFYQFLAQHVKYPKKAIKARQQGTVYVRFIVDENGKVEHAESIEGRELGYGLDEEACRVVALTQWIPAKQRGMAVKQRKILPVKFRL